MKSNKLKYIISLASCVIAFSSCNDWLSEPSPGSTGLEDYFTSGDAAIQTVNACYTPLMWEFNSTYYSEWFIGDIASDDALKGGQSVSDMADVYDIENFKVNTNNTLLLDYYRAQYQGIGRCNLAISEIVEMDADTTMTESVQQRILGEAYFLRAMYYFRLGRMFGNVPLVDFVIDSSDAWIQPQATQTEIYEFVADDLERAYNGLWKKSEYDAADLGRATQGAALAMLMKVNLYLHNYDKAMEWGTEFFNTNASEYSLCPDYRDNFTVEDENGVESVFEIQYITEATSDYGEGDGFTRGTFTTIMVRSRSSVLGSGWGFNKPTQDLYDAFEEGDPRREYTIINPTDEQMETPEQEIYLGSRYLNRKSAWMYDDDTYGALEHNARGELNNTIIRYADVLLMYAEAACESNSNTATGIAKLNEVRTRVDMSEYSTSMTQDEFRTAVRNERRVELAMEGHRWFDLCRWGTVKEVMDTYKDNESTEASNEMAVFIEDKHELMPLPSEEVVLGSLTQNPGY